MAIDSQSPNATSTGFTQTRAASQSAANQTIFDKYALAAFTLSNGLKVAFPVQTIRQDGANRVIERERPYRDGAKLDDTGSKAIRWTFTCTFHNSIQEPGLAEFNSQRNLYPDAMNDLISIFDEGQTGDLDVPTIGRVRAKAADYSRIEDVNIADGAVMTLVFIEDNEDNVDSRSITAPTVNAQGNRLAFKTTFDAQSQSIAGNGLAQLRTAASQLETLLNGPGDALDDIRITANTVRHSIEQVETAYTNAGQAGRDALSDPTSTDAGRALAALNDAALRSANEPRRGRPLVVSVITRDPTNLQDIATVLKQDYFELLDINAELTNALFIPPFTIVKIFANAANS